MNTSGFWAGVLKKNLKSKSSLSFDLSQICTESPCSDWWLKSKFVSPMSFMSSLMPRSQCRGSLGDQFYFHDVVENIESGINPPKTYKESVVTLWEISYRILTRFDGKFMRSAPDQPPTISDTISPIASECICGVLRWYLRQRRNMIPPYDWSEAPVENRTISRRALPHAIGGHRRLIGHFL